LCPNLSKPRFDEDGDRELVGSGIESNMHEVVRPIDIEVKNMDWMSE
jgi:hypothetical protein